MAELAWKRGSAVVQAGAGTGKTHNLVSLCVQLLSGAEPLPPARLWAVTFTEKAAAELMGRIRARIDGLAAGDPAWRRVRRDLGLAQIGTIHALCAQILRRHAAGAGIDPGFRVLDEAEGARLRAGACETVALHALEGGLGHEAQAAARRLCAEMGLRTQARFGSGLADELAALLGRAGETALEAPQLSAAAVDAVNEDARARRAFDSALRALRSSLLAAGKDAPAPVAATVLGRAAGELVSVYRDLMPSSPVRLRAQGPEKDAISAAKAAWEALLAADAGVRGASLARDLAALWAHAANLHRELKARASALDFDDLTRLCRDLLVQRPAARTAERERVGALLVDEFQDTSRAQIELLEALAGDRPVVVVGDRKQSIYEFRGADVASAQAFAGRLLAGGAERFVLAQSRRSRPALVQFTNLLCSRAMPPSERSFETPFLADDALTAFRPAGAEGACVELLDVGGTGVEAEAELLARRIAALLAPDAPERVHDADEQPRLVRGGDIAVLLRKTTNLEAFRRALLRRRIPHLVYKGRGFHGAREVADLVALLGAACDPDDTLALSAVLRSPFGPLSDGALVQLAQRRWKLDDASGLAPDDAEALRRLAPLLSALRREVDHLGPAALLEAALAETDYVASAAGGLYGEQAAANVDKLVALARAAELRGEGVRAFLASLQKLADEETREPEAGVVEERDPHAVRLLTIHAAKGLEFPVVFVPECAAPAWRGEVVRALLDPDLGLAVKARSADGKRRWGAHGLALEERRADRGLAESRRLLYVAVTRARDFLVLSGRAAQKQDSWRLWIDETAPEAVRRGLLRIVRNPEAAVAKVQRAPVEPLEIDRLPPCDHPDVRRLEAPHRAASVTLTVPVTQLADAVACARRYQLLHELGFEEHPGPDGPSAGESAAGTAPANALGTLAHRLLELVPLGLPRPEQRRELARALELEGEDPSRHEEILDAACAFLDSPLALRMARLRSDRLHRELPFALRLSRPGAPELLVRGQIDALLIEDSATVVDYKLSRARDTARYAPQLDMYALAARELMGGALPVRTGIVFLRSAGAPFVEREPGEATATRTRLLDAATAIADGRRTGEWPGIAPEECRGIECGFFRRCHGSSSSSSSSGSSSSSS